MKKLLGLVCIGLLAACAGKKKLPDVSKVAVKLSTQRFEQDLFGLDTAKLDDGLQVLRQRYNSFSMYFLQNIIALPPQPDSALKVMQLFRQAYQPVYADVNNVYKDFSKEEAAIKKAFQYVAYYFPEYALPTQLVTYIGPWDALFMLNTKTSGSGVFREGRNLGIGLQFALGAQYPVYQQPFFQQAYPNYIAKRFTREHIPVDALKVIIDDLYPVNSTGKPLIEQMIEAGKRLYVLDAFMPETADSLKTGYTQQQLDGCYKNESNIWSFFVTNDLLYSNELQIVRDYMNDAPNTQAFGEASPGFIGQFVGWQIVKKWMSKHDATTLPQLLAKSPKEIFEEAKYKP